MIKLRIYTPENQSEHEADAVFLPGSYAPFEVLPGHAPIISTLSDGTVRWVSGGEESSVGIKSGVMRLDGDMMEICAES